MRTIVLSGCLACLSATLLGTPQAPVRDPAVILSQAREALGGDKHIANVKNFVATGRTRQVRGDNLVPIEFEIAVELPDKYVRKDEIPAQESGPTSTGFNGEELIQLPVPAPPPAAAAPARPGAPAPNPAMLDAARRARVNGVRQDFMRLTLGMFATSFASYPLTFSYVGQAEAPEGKADVIDVKGPDNYTVRLFINSQTHLPIMVSWTITPPVRGRAAGPAAGAMPPGGAQPAGAPPAPAGGPPAAAPAAPPAPPPAGAPAAGRPTTPAPGAPASAAPPGAAPGAAAPQAPGAQPPPAPPKPVEHRLYYADYRPVGNLQLPFRLRRAVGPDTTEETTFDRFRINAKIDPKKFENPK